MGQQRACSRPRPRPRPRIAGTHRTGSIPPAPRMVAISILVSQPVAAHMPACRGGHLKFKKKNTWEKRHPAPALPVRAHPCMYRARLQLRAGQLQCKFRGRDECMYMGRLHVHRVDAPPRRDYRTKIDCASTRTGGCLACFASAKYV